MLAAPKQKICKDQSDYVNFYLQFCMIIAVQTLVETPFQLLTASGDIPHGQPGP
jgi:hypothetical protein